MRGESPSSLEHPSWPQVGESNHRARSRHHRGSGKWPHARILAPTCRLSAEPWASEVCPELSGAAARTSGAGQRSPLDASLASTPRDVGRETATQRWPHNEPAVQTATATAYGFNVKRAGRGAMGSTCRCDGGWTM